MVFQFWATWPAKEKRPALVDLFSLAGEEGFGEYEQKLPVDFAISMFLWYRKLIKRFET